MTEKVEFCRNVNSTTSRSRYLTWTSNVMKCQSVYFCEIQPVLMQNMLSDQELRF